MVCDNVSPDIEAILQIQWNGLQRKCQCPLYCGVDLGHSSMRVLQLNGNQNFQCLQGRNLDQSPARYIYQKSCIKKLLGVSCVVQQLQKYILLLHTHLHQLQNEVAPLLFSLFFSSCVRDTHKMLHKTQVFKQLYIVIAVPFPQYIEYRYGDHLYCKQNGHNDQCNSSYGSSACKQNTIIIIIIIN